MLRVARSAASLLPDAGLVRRFLAGQVHEDGGFKGRRETSDLYYTVFGLEGLLALGAEDPCDRVAGYLRRFGEGQSLDLVHLACLARCWANLPGQLPPAATRRAIGRRIESFRSADGGYAQVEGRPRGTVYACFLAVGAYQDLQGDLPAPGGLARCIESLRTRDGAYANTPAVEFGSTAATAAAVTALRQLGEPIRRSVGDWLLGRLHPTGGFLAMPLAPLPDLLSTATALHALAGMKLPLDDLRPGCLDFVEGLRSPQGGFYASRADDVLDCEYAYYALLTLGHLVS